MTLVLAGAGVMALLVCGAWLWRRRVRTVQAPRAGAVSLQELLDQLPCAVYWKDRDSVYLGCNREFAALDRD